MNMSKRILFVFAAILLAGAGIFFRASSMRTARDSAAKIVASDTASGNVSADIASLKNFVKSHMGTTVSFTLKSGYDRALAAAKAASASNSNSQIYADAQKACSGKNDSITLARCNEQYLAQHLANAPAPVVVPAPLLSHYQHKLVAPLWTPDLAGALYLGALVSLVFALPIGRKKPKSR
jgi:hypothetical protein